MSCLPAHLVHRFVGALRARPLAPSEQAEVAARLRPEEAALFWAQPRADQRHAFESARAVSASAPERDDLARAALLHDVGKRHARLGIPGRSLASGLALLHLPTPGRLGTYLEHGPLGAAELEAAGAEPLVVAFARHHHGLRPHQADPCDWDLLCAADGH